MSLKIITNKVQCEERAGVMVIKLSACYHLTYKKYMPTILYTAGGHRHMPDFCSSSLFICVYYCYWSVLNVNQFLVLLLLIIRLYIAVLNILLQSTRFTHRKAF